MSLSKEPFPSYGTHSPSSSPYLLLHSSCPAVCPTSHPSLLNLQLGTPFSMPMPDPWGTLAGHFGVPRSCFFQQAQGLECSSLVLGMRPWCTPEFGGVQLPSTWAPWGLRPLEPSRGYEAASPGLFGDRDGAAAGIGGGFIPSPLPTLCPTASMHLPSLARCHRGPGPLPHPFQSLPLSNLSPLLAEAPPGSPPLEVFASCLSP